MGPPCQALSVAARRKWCIPELLVAAAILAAVEPWRPARRDWRASSRNLGISSAGPGGKMRALNGSQDGRRYSGANNLAAKVGPNRAGRAYHQVPGILSVCAKPEIIFAQTLVCMNVRARRESRPTGKSARQFLV